MLDGFSWMDADFDPISDEIVRLQRVALAISDHFRHYGRIVTDATYGAEADEARQLMQDLRDELAEAQS